MPSCSLRALKIMMNKMKLLLTETEYTSLKSFLASLDIDDTWSFADNDVYYRAEDYYMNGAIKEVFFRGEHELSARILGTDYYETTIKLDGQQAWSECTCPYEGVCKHIIALLLYATKHLDSIQQEPGIDDTRLKKYLASLPRKKLEELVIEYAPKSFKVYVENLSLPSDKTKPKLDLCIKEINHLFENQELLYEPGDFEANLLKQLEKIEGIWEQYPYEGKKLILDIIKNVDIATEEGYLYSSYYDDTLDTSVITGYFFRFIKTLETHEKILFIEEIEEEIQYSSYDNFGHLFSSLQELYHPGELQDVKNYYLEALENGYLSNAENYAKVLDKEFSSEERYRVLEKIHHLNPNLAIEYADACQERGNTGMAAHAIRHYLDSHTDSHSYGHQDLYKKLLEFKKELGKDTRNIAIEAVKNVPTVIMIEVALQHAPQEKEKLEDILKIKNPGIFFDYLESQGRLDEALRFLNNTYISEERKFVFFRKYKRSFKEASGQYFIDRIHQNLVYTGDRYYRNIADTLKELRTVDKKTAESMLREIRSEYKRRRNLMSLLDEM